MLKESPMTTPFLRRFSPFALAVLFGALLPGCFIIVDRDDDDDVVPNNAPLILEDDTYWFCELNEGIPDYFFEFQAAVDDLDGLGDIDQVEATVYNADSGGMIESVSLIDEGAGVYGGLIWESESPLYCGDPHDVTFEVWDFLGAYDSFTLYY
jgi:hypothetical protein